MRDDARLRVRIKRLVEPVEIPVPSIDAVADRARTLRARRAVAAAIVAVLVIAAIAIPLSGLGALGERDRRVGTDMPTPSGTPSPSSSPSPVDEGPALQVPAGWFLDEDPLPALVRPTIVAAAGSWRFPRQPLIACGRQPALADMPSDGAFVWIYRYSIGPGEFLGAFRNAPPWPERFALELPSSPGDVECAAGTDGSVRQYAFAGPDRIFYQVLVALGPEAAAATRRQVERVVSSFSP